MEAFQQTVTNMSQRSHSDPLKKIQGYRFFKTLSQTVAHSLPAVSTQLNPGTVNVPL